MTLQKSSDRNSEVLRNSAHFVSRQPTNLNEFIVGEAPKIYYFHIIILYHINTTKFIFLTRAQQESIAKEEDKEKHELLERKKLSEFQLRQIRENEQKQMDERAKAFREREEYMQQQQQLVNELREIKHNKLTEMRTRYPEIPCHFLEHLDRRGKIPAKEVLKAKSKTSRI